MKNLDYHNLLWKSVIQNSSGIEFILEVKDKFGIEDQEFFKKITIAYKNFLECYFKERDNEKNNGSIKKEIYTNDLLKYPELRNFSTNLVLEDIFDAKRLDSIRFKMNLLNSHFENLNIKTEKYYDNFIKPANSYTLKNIWKEYSMTIYRPEEIINAGINQKIWDENKFILTIRGSPYSTGKELLSCLYHALMHVKAISEDDVNYKMAGKAFCSEFDFKSNHNDPKVNQPYKTFETYKNEQAFKAFVGLIEKTRDRKYR